MIYPLSEIEPIAEKTGFNIQVVGNGGCTFFRNIL